MLLIFKCSFLCLRPRFRLLRNRNLFRFLGQHRNCRESSTLDPVRQRQAISLLAINYRLKFEKIRQDFVPLNGQKAFRMKLNTLDLELFMAKPHQFALIDRLG